MQWDSGPRFRSRSVSTDIAAYLEQLIRSGQIRPGEKIPPEREIAENFGVSRTSVRQALHELTLKGLTDRKPGRGTVVTAVDPRAGTLMDSLEQEARQLSEITDLRQVIEPAVASRAAERVEPNVARQLEEMLSRAESVAGAAESTELDEQFHLLLAHATGNPLLVAIVEVLNDWTADVRRQSHSTPEGRAQSSAGHQRILEAIKSHNLSLASEEMLKHISDVEKIVASSNSRPEAEAMGNQADLAD